MLTCPQKPFSSCEMSGPIRVAHHPQCRLKVRCALTRPAIHHRHRHLSQDTLGIMTPAWLLSQTSNAGCRQQSYTSAWLHLCHVHYVCLYALPWCMQIYPITMASWIFGREPPSSVNALAVLHKSGVDITSVVNLK